MVWSTSSYCSQALPTRGMLAVTRTGTASYKPHTHPNKGIVHSSAGSIWAQTTNAGSGSLIEARVSVTIWLAPHHTIKAIRIIGTCRYMNVDRDVRISGDVTPFEETMMFEYSIR